MLRWYWLWRVAGVPVPSSSRQPLAIPWASGDPTRNCDDPQQAAAANDALCARYCSGSIVDSTRRPALMSAGHPTIHR